MLTISALVVPQIFVFYRIVSPFTLSSHYRNGKHMIDSSFVLISTTGGSHLNKKVLDFVQNPNLDLIFFSNHTRSQTQSCNLSGLSPTESWKKCIIKSDSPIYYYIITGAHRLSWFSRLLHSQEHFIKVGTNCFRGIIHWSLKSLAFSFTPSSNWKLV